MRELRTFELDGSGRPVSWRAREGQTITARQGRLWLTVEGHHADIWLVPGDVAVLPEGQRVWLSGDAPGASFTLAQAASPWSVRRLAKVARTVVRRATGRPAGLPAACWTTGH
ncbi:DUF2917 domain-containing protein [Cupriavidus respiraculi]|uniref:DUF2917 domain-containing protein n=1 Tax=Cupriavidus respiraculi TaxID=195930 RepID=A0ABM8X6E3_9BURK|nr:DUF2917 domain-containing protein [Cupriavidus respiraculi]CAG9175459.1 hypothetical protein LMG21510_02875 [Cupriavidus respiraculi]